MTASRQVAVVVGASRGIGRQIAIDLAKNGFAGEPSKTEMRKQRKLIPNTVVVAAKTSSDAYSAAEFPPDPNSRASTINTVEREIKEDGGEAMAIVVDTRNNESIQSLIDQTIQHYARLDVLIYNSGAIYWASVESTPVKRFQLMQKVNSEGLYCAVQAALPYFRANGWKGRIIVVYAYHSL